MYQFHFVFPHFSKIVKLLVEDERVDPEAESNYALTEATKRGHLAVVTVLKEAIDKRRLAEKDKATATKSRPAPNREGRLVLSSFPFDPLLSRNQMKIARAVTGPSVRVAWWEMRKLRPSPTTLPQRASQKTAVL